MSHNHQCEETKKQTNLSQIPVRTGPNTYIMDLNDDLSKFKVWGWCTLFHYCLRFTPILKNNVEGCVNLIGQPYFS